MRIFLLHRIKIENAPEIWLPRFGNGFPTRPLTQAKNNVLIAVDFVGEGSDRRCTQRR